MDKSEENIDQAKLIVEKFFDKLKMNALLKNPDATIDELINSILIEVTRETVMPAIKESVRFVKSVSNTSQKETG